MRVLDLFSGIGGFSLGLERAGMRTVAFCEIDPHARAVLKDHWPRVPVYEDVCQLSGARLRADGISVDAICGGFPCQDISIANQDGRGLAGARSGLWYEYARLIGEVGPRLVIVENVSELLARGMGQVIGTLADLGYDAEWRMLRGLDFGLPFIGERIVIIATPKREGREGRFEYLSSLGVEATPPTQRRHQAIGARRQLETDLHSLRADDGLSVTMERRRIHGLGNSIPPQFAQAVGEAIMLYEQKSR